jgi:hypothetical protein
VPCGLRAKGAIGSFGRGDRRRSRGERAHRRARAEQKQRPAGLIRLDRGGGGAQSCGIAHQHAERDACLRRVAEVRQRYDQPALDGEVLGVAPAKCARAAPSTWAGRGNRTPAQRSPGG